MHYKELNKTKYFCGGKWEQEGRTEIVQNKEEMDQRQEVEGTQWQNLSGRDNWISW